MPELTFSDVYNTGTSYFNLTELEVIAGATKSFVEILCPTPIEYRLGVTGFGAIANLLELRAYPEYVNKYIAALMVGLQHHLNRLRIAAIVTGSTAVDLSATAPWSVDTSVISRVLPAMELAAVDIRSRLRLAENSTIEIVLPQWILAQMRADWMRRSGIGGPEGISLADSVIVRHAAMIGCRVQFVRDYQDAYSGLATGPGGAAALLKLPTTVKFLAYPAGTWVIAELDVITLSTVYDAVRLAANQRLEAFVETGWRMIPKGPISREYEVDVCPSGGTGVSAAITC
jgi:hypothetical protein